MPSFPQFNPIRIRSYIFRLPLCTRGLIVAILALYVATIPFPWLRDFAALEPAKMDLTQSTSFLPVLRMRVGLGRRSSGSRILGGVGGSQMGTPGDGRAIRRNAGPRKSFRLEHLGGSIYVRKQPEANTCLVVHRLNLFPVMHLNFFHMIFNLIAVTPLVERFESEYGTLVTLALFTGRKRMLD
jgi:hypothetical protein